MGLCVEDIHKVNQTLLRKLLLTVQTPNTVSCLTAEPLPLMDLCRRAARLALGRERIHHIDTLPLPQTLKNYLQYQ